MADEADEVASPGAKGGAKDREVRSSPTEESLPAGPSAPPWNTMDRTRSRSGRGVLERKALFAVQRELEALPASILVQLLLWPETISAWAESAGVRSSQAYNTLAGVKWYHDVRQKLADRLGVPKGDVDYLIDARRPLPTGQRRPMPADDWSPGGAVPSPGRAAGAEAGASAPPPSPLPPSSPPSAPSSPSPAQGQLPL